MTGTARQIIEASLAPHEWRLFAGEEITTPEAADAAQRLLERWRTVVALRATSPDAFEKRLAVIGIEERSAAGYVLPRRMAGDGPAPEWASMLERALLRTEDECIAALGWAGEETSGERDLFEMDRHPGPRFARFVSPFVAEFRASAGPSRQPEATRPVARSLVRRLSSMCGRTVAYELRLARETGELSGDTPEARYGDFIARRLSNPEARLQMLLRYPVLARILATLTANFTEAANEVIERLDRDREAIVSDLLDGSEPGEARHCFPGLSDMHCGGRSAWIVQFENGSRVVYKPRDYSADRAWERTVGWLNAKSSSLRLRTARFVARDGYGWSEFIPARECESEAASRRYYRRQGFHAALVYFLCGQDFHADNFVAHTEFPVPVDLEGLLSPSLAVPPPQMAGMPAVLLSLQFTIANSLLLPYWRGGKRERPLYVASGIGGSGNRLWPVKRPGWRDLNTDTFGIEFDWRAIEFKSSVPRFQNREMEVDVAEVEAGLREAWQIIVESRDELLAEGGPLDAFRGMRSRFLFRDTQDYDDLLFWTTAPDLLSSGAAYDVALEMLAGSVPVFFTGISFPGLIDEEKRCLWNRDIPIAVANTSETSILIPGGQSFGPVIDSPMFDQMRTRVRNASETDLEIACALIRTTLEMAREREVRGDSKGYESGEARILDCAVAIGEDLERTAFRAGRHTGWVGFVRFAGAASRVHMVQTEPWSLNGDAGNALFLINLARATGEQQFEKTGRDALESAITALDEMVRSGLLNLVGVSGYVGYFGLVYALAAAGVQLHDAAMFQTAIDVASRYPAEKIREEQNPDFLTGAAGPVAILSWLHSLTGDERPLQMARDFASVIASRAVDGGRNGWQVPFFKRPLLGMAHGSAGIAAALMRLYRQTGAGEYHDVACAGLAHERDHFQAADGEWPNLQEEPGRIAYMTGWCAGAAGIGLARLEALACGFDHPEIRAEIESAITATRRSFGGIQHHACCGEAGRITFMQTAARALNRPELRAEALAAARAMLDQFESQNYWYLQEFCERLAIPGLLAGVPGVGMALLSVVYPAVSGVLTLC